MPRFVSVPEDFQRFGAHGEYDLGAIYTPCMHDRDCSQLTVLAMRAPGDRFRVRVRRPYIELNELNDDQKEALLLSEAVSEAKRRIDENDFVPRTCYLLS